jgi:predicted nuclease of predicted toxin-antitoxin system
MKIKLDENLSRHLEPHLARLGHDVHTAEEEGLVSQPDTRVAAAATSEDRMLFTLDVEFADLRKYPPGTHPGIVLFRPESFGPRSVNAFIEEFVRNSDLENLHGCVVVVEPKRVRVRTPKEGGAR